MRIIKRFFIFIALLIGFIIPSVMLHSSLSPAESSEIEKLYWNADFVKVSKTFEKKNFLSLTIPQKLIYIECLAKTGQGNLALEKLKGISGNDLPAADRYAILGLVQLSLGNLVDAEHNLNKAREIDTECKTVVLLKVVFLLYHQNYSEAEKWFEKYLKINPKKMYSHYIYMLGTEVYSASRNSKKMYDFYSKQSKWAKKKKKNNYVSLKANARLYKKMAGQTLFEVKMGPDTAIIPFMKKQANSRHFFISLNLKNKEYKVLLDTGNATGWIIHNRILLENLKTKRGGRIVAMIGTEAEELDGYHIHTRAVNFNGLNINNLKGLYVPKPRPDFFDANLNPIFIRNMIVTIDCIKNQLVLRKKERFERDISLIRKKNLIRLPWYGYERAFIPVVVNGNKRGLGMVETGAEDISIKLGFARRHNFKLEPRIKYLANGKVYRFFETPIKVFLGNFCFERQKAEVWSFDRFYNRFSGLTADVIMGPLAFAGKFSLSFDPFAKEIIIITGDSNSEK